MLLPGVKDCSDDDLLLAWLNIKSQLHELLKDGQSSNAIESIHDIANFKLKKETVESLLTVLARGYDHEIIELLQNEEYDYQFTEETYIDDIKKVRNELACEALHIAELQTRLREMGNESTATEESSIYETIQRLQKHFGLCAGKSPLSASKELTVYEYGVFCNKYNQQASKSKPKEDVTE